MTDTPHGSGSRRSSAIAGTNNNSSTPTAADSSGVTIRQRTAAAPLPSPLGLSGVTAGLSPHQLGIGRPRAPSTDLRIYTSDPPTPTSRQGMGIPARSGSISSIDSSNGESHATPRTSAGGYFPPVDQMSRHVSEVQSARGSTSGLLSPNPYHTVSTPYGRISRPRIKDGEVPRSAGVSRSASRARLALPHQPASNLKDDMEDDELVLVDRGEDLIRRRIKERKRAKRERERERERRLAAEADAAGEEEDDEGEPPTPLLSGSALVPISTQLDTVGGNRAPPIRSSSHSRARASSAASRPSVTGAQSLADSVELERPASALSVPIEENSDDLVDNDAHESIAPDGSVVCGDSDESGNEEDDESGSNGDTEGVTVRDRQDAINIEHPFGLPIWKPALYRKSRSVTRNAENALHSMPSAAAERHLLPGNILWVAIFGWWLAISCFSVAMVVTGVECLVGGRGGYGNTLRGLAWYIGWPFGKYVEGEGAPHDRMSGDSDTETADSRPLDEENAQTTYGTGDTQFTNPFLARSMTQSTSSTATVRPADSSSATPADDPPVSPTETVRTRRGPGVSFAPGVKAADESVPLLRPTANCPGKKLNRRARRLGLLFYWPGFLLVVAPLMLLVCGICWLLVFTIPMAKLTWELIVLLWTRPLEINFRSAPKVAVTDDTPKDGNASDGNGDVAGSSTTSVRRARLKKGQIAPTAGPTSTVLLCTYRAVGLQYYKYTVGGVNIMFINLLPLVFFTIFDGLVLLPMVEKMHEDGRHVLPFLLAISSPALIFILGLASVIPLSYFLGMAVASISAQSSIGMGAVINATFGSIIEIVLYGIALTQGKGRLVEGSIVGSILAGVLLMPGMSMCSGALKRKSQKFNAKSAGVTSTMLIMAIIGTLTPTMFYQTYGSFQLHCEGCPEPGTMHDPNDAWKCSRCFYEYPEPTTDPFYQHQVKSLMYACAIILLLSYLIGLWFSLRTHASQIWQNPQRIMAKEEMPQSSRATLARVTPAGVMNSSQPVNQDVERSNHHHHNVNDGQVTPRRVLSPHRRLQRIGSGEPLSPSVNRKDFAPEAAAPSPHPGAQAHSGYTPLIESLNPANKGGMDNLPSLPAPMTQEDFRRAVHTLAHAISNKKQQPAPVEEDDEGGGHEAPSWTRGISTAVLLSCTLLYAMVAEVLVDVVDVVLQGSGVDEKFLGLTLFALVPNTTEFMNAMSFAMHGNIALSMEIGSAYALQVCLLQIPAMVAFSAWTNPAKFGDQVDTFTLLFPRWDVISIILSIFLLTYTYIEAKANYHRGSILVLSYVVLVLGFYYAPHPAVDADGGVIVGYEHIATATSRLSSSVADTVSLAMTKLWA